MSRGTSWEAAANCSNASSGRLSFSSFNPRWKADLAALRSFLETSQPSAPRTLLEQRGSGLLGVTSAAKTEAAHTNADASGSGKRTTQIVPATWVLAEQKFRCLVPLENDRKWGTCVKSWFVASCR